MRTFPQIRNPAAIKIDSRRKLRGREVCLACLHAADARLELVTGDWERLLGYARAALHGLPLANLLDARSLERLLDPEESDPVELEARMKDGTLRSLRVYRRFEANAPAALYLACEPFPGRTSRVTLPTSAFSML